MAGGFKLVVNVDSLGLTKPVHSLLTAVESMRPMMDIAGGIFENSTRARFHGEHGPDNIPWPITWRKKVDASATILQKDGHLLGSIRSVVGDNFVETGVDGRSVSAKYAKTQQFGAVIRAKSGKALAFTGADGHFRMVQSVKIPARPFVGIDTQDVTDLREAFVDYLEGQANGS